MLATTRDLSDRLRPTLERPRETSAENGERKIVPACYSQHPFENIMHDLDKSAAKTTD